MTTTAGAITAALVADELERARHRTLALLDPIPDVDQRRQVSDLMSPLCWDLAHIAHYEELWLLRELAAVAPTDPRFDDLYDAFKHPRRERITLPILDPDGARAFAAEVRARVLDRLDDVDLDGSERDGSERDGSERDGANPLLRDGFVYGMVAQHEHQHDETMLATIQLMGDQFAHPAATLDIVGAAGAKGGPVGAAGATGGPVDPAATCSVPAQRVVIGTNTTPWAYDNERPEHEVDIGPFVIDRYPVTNGRYAAFVHDGGYGDPHWWTDDGWARRVEAGLAQPEFWRSEGGESWSRLRFGRREDLPPLEPVQHVGWHEATAFARWSGSRLPTEVEWEAAAADARIDAANLGQRRFAPLPVGSVPDGASRWGCEQMLGDVWEWTSSSFTGYPGFAVFPYREYSEVFFGDDYKVLRGGSWATDPIAMRTTFRNWDYPIRRQIFSGFRCARDA